MGNLVEMINIHKRFGGITALRGVDFTIGYNETVGLVGDNGAGKSTLIKILTGVHQPDKGEIYFEGKKVKIRDPMDAIKLGIETVYQERALCGNMNIPRNFFVGRELSKSLGIIKRLDIKKMEEISINTLKEMGLHIKNPNIEVKFLSGGEQQGVAMGRAIYFKPKLLILDEPTIGLSVKESQKVLDYVLQLKKAGVPVVFISHNLYHVHPIADRLVVLRSGEKIADLKKEEVSIDELAEMIIAS